jgi:energy-coupling factor transport system ATP-binding protein
MKILSQLRDYHRRTGCTVLLVSHSMEDVAKYVSKLLVLSHAKVVSFDTPAKVFADGERLTEMGLALPQITRVFHGLRARGFDIPDEVYTVKYGAELLLQMLKGGGPGC